MAGDKEREVKLQELSQKASDLVADAVRLIYFNIILHYYIALYIIWKAACLLWICLISKPFEVWPVVKKTKNYTFSLPLDLLDRLKEHASTGNVPSVNFAVKEAIETYVVKIDKENLYKQMKKAAEDPLFMDDLESTMTAFSAADLF